MITKAFILAISCVALTSAQYPINGTCPDFTKCRDPNIVMTADKIVGLWYLQSSIPYFFQLQKKCTYVNFEKGDKKNEMSFKKIEYGDHNNKRRDTYGDFEFTKKGFIDLTYTDLLLPFNFTTLRLTSDYWVVASCYECDFFGYAPGIYGYVLTRLQYPECEVTNIAEKSWELCGVSSKGLVTENQSDCRFC